MAPPVVYLAYTAGCSAICILQCNIYIYIYIYIALQYTKEGALVHDYQRKKLAMQLWYTIVMGDTNANISILPILAVLIAISSTTRKYRMSRDQ